MTAWALLKNKMYQVTYLNSKTMCTPFFVGNFVRETWTPLQGRRGVNKGIKLSSDVFEYYNYKGHVL